MYKEKSDHVESFGLPLTKSGRTLCEGDLKREKEITYCFKGRIQDNHRLLVVEGCWWKIFERQNEGPQEPGWLFWPLYSTTTVATRNVELICKHLINEDGQQDLDLSPKGDTSDGWFRPCNCPPTLLLLTAVSVSKACRSSRVLLFCKKADCRFFKHNILYHIIFEG